MPKPTLLQRIFNAPSQSYASPTSAPAHRPLDTQYFHSVKQAMLKAAAEVAANSIGDTHRPSAGISAQLTSAASFSTATAHGGAPQRVEKSSSEDRDRGKESSNSNSSGSDSGDEFFTPDTSPSEPCCEDAGRLGACTVHGFPTTPPAQEDVTGPATGHRPSAAALFSRPRSLSSASCSSTCSVASSSTAAASYSHSELSWPTSRSAPSSRATTPVDVDIGKPRVDCPSPSRSSSRKREEKRQTMYTDDDWARDVRWLVGPTPGIPPPSSSSSSSSGSKRRPVRKAFGPDSLQTPLPAPSPNGMRSAHRRSSSTNAMTTGPRPRGRRRMSAVWEEDEGDESSDSPPPRRVHTDPAPLSSLRRSQTALPHSLQQRVRPSSSLSSNTGASVYTSPSLFVDIPVPLAVSDGGTPSGFTSLVLPRAAYTPPNRYSLRFGSDSHIDITRSGLSQTTMSTISITKNAAAATYGSRRLSLSTFTILTSGSETKLKLSSTTPAHLLTSLPSPLSFTSITSPPSKVNSNQIMVQVYAVGLDGLDNLIVSEKSSRNDCYGFVPGRSFVGRAIECGFEVNSISKSDWVMGLLDVRKCGALAEFIVIDKRRSTRCPRPSPGFTLEQLVLLPLCGVSAHRAVRTFADVHEKGRALVLQGHDGAGALAVQELVASGMHVTVQVPPGTPDSEKVTGSTQFDEERVRRWGAAVVCVDDAISVIESFAANSLDFVIDTVGGRQVWDACRRVLRTHGQFTTLVGESAQAVPSLHAHVRANMRSLRRAFVKKDRKALGYAWISPAADVDFDGEDVRDSLVAVGKLAADGILSPWVDTARCETFECAPALFSLGEQVTLKDGRTGVVRIID